MPVELYRVDDRLIHGQVVVGWGQPLNIRLIVLVDDDVARCDWEKDLYRMGVPPEMELRFADVATAVREHASYVADPRRCIVLTGNVATMGALLREVKPTRGVNIGGLHHRPGRNPKLRYVFLTPEEESELRELTAGGVKVTAQDVPSARAVPLEEMLRDTPGVEKSV
jgi:PTS system mannose-specific IIB component/fructoselysine and glucoselysine-specific PTS system IIB component